MEFGHFSTVEDPEEIAADHWEVDTKNLGEELDRFQSSAEFSKLPRKDQLRMLMMHSLNVIERSPESIDELKEKPWGGYITLGWEKEGSEGENTLKKLLIVYPRTALDLEAARADKDTEQFRNSIARIVGSEKLIALSFQAHPLVRFDEEGNKVSTDWERSDRDREIWRTASGTGGYHLTAEDTGHHQPDFDQITATKLDSHTRTAVSHAGLRWHSLVNTGDDYLVIEEDIITPNRSKFAETNIERHGDLFNRSGSSKNI